MENGDTQLESKGRGNEVLEEGAPSREEMNSELEEADWETGAQWGKS
jgi:hypothetical protein